MSKSNVTQQLFCDELVAIQEEKRFALSVDHGRSPFQEESTPHVGEGGATTLYVQNAKVVAFSSRVRDPLNRTWLVCVDLRE